MAERDKPKSWVIYGDWSDSREPPKVDVWDRESKVTETGLLDVLGRPIKRRVKGMDPIGFVVLKG